MNGTSPRIALVTLPMVLVAALGTPCLAGQPARPGASPKPAKPAAAAPPAAPQAAPTTPPAEPPPAPSGPDPAIVERAKERKLEGDKAMDALRYTDALTAYNEAYALNPEPAILYNLGRTLEALDRLPEALEKLEAFRTSAPPELLAKVPGLKDRIANIQKRVSQLTIKVSVEGARILVRDAVVGQSPLDKPLALKAGKASILIEADGYFPYQANVDLPGGGGYALDAQLSSREKMGRLLVRAPKTNVSVTLDGRSLGQAPLETLADAGTHKIMARHPEHSDYTTTVIVKPGEERTVMITLGDPPIYKRWWFWTTIGAVVVGGTVTTIVVLTERDPDRGDIAPFQLTPSSNLGGSGSPLAPFTQSPSFYVVTPPIKF